MVRMVGHGARKIIALHGWLGTGASWLDTMGWLDPETYSVALPDHRGYGDRIGVSGDFTIDEIASDTLKLAEALDWSEFVLVGHSMGAKAAQRVVSIAPAHVRRVVAVTPVPPGALEFEDATLAFFRSAAADAAVRGAIIAEGTSHRHLAAFVNRLVRVSIEQSTVEAFARYGDQWIEANFAAEVEGSVTPILVIAGQYDRALTLDLMRQAILPLYRKAELVEPVGCGHSPVDETPVALATEIDRFLSRPVV